MDNPINLLQRIINKQNDFCCLCLQTVIGFRYELDDMVSMQENNLEKHVKLIDVVAIVFGDKIAADISGFDKICGTCTTTLVNSYTFIKETKDNVQQLTNMIDNMDSSFNFSPGYLKDCKTLYLTLDKNFEDSNHYFDHIGQVDNTTEALQRINVLKKKYKSKGLKNLKMFVINSESNVTTKSVRIKKTISTTDMLTNGKDKAVLQCKECLKVFNSVSNLRNHFLRLHAPKEYKCPICPKSFATMAFLKVHQSDSHVTNMCSECGKTFNNIHSLRQHERGHYLRLVCQDCGRVYKNQNTYNKHKENKVCQMEVRHSPADAKFECDYCHKKYTQKMSLRVHIQYEHGNYKSHICEWCNKKFWCQSRLKAHIVKHTKEKNFTCTTCNGKFVTKESLLYHTRIHTGEKPYQCHLCDSRFLSASRRAAHIRTHHSNPTEECDICHGKFRSINYLLKHKKMHEKPEINTELNLKEVKTSEGAFLKSENVEFDKTAAYENSLNKDNQQNIFYRVVTEDNIIEFQEDNSRKVEYYLVNKRDSQPMDEKAHIYFEVTEDGNYDIKVSENVEV